MARTISASVGRMGGVNRRPDVRTVQELLNQVPPHEGGPHPLLMVDEVCGPKTTEAIQRFQLHHFGWKGADGRVDPDGPTLAKLNEYDRPRLRTLWLQCVLEPGRYLRIGRPEDWFFKVGDLARPGTQAVYHLSDMVDPLQHKRLHVPVVFMGERVDFQTSRSISDLETRSGNYATGYSLPDPDRGPSDRWTPIFSSLSLVFLAKTPASGQPKSTFEKYEIFYPADIEPPLLEPDPDNPATWGRWVGKRMASRMGTFKRVK